MMLFALLGSKAVFEAAKTVFILNEIQDGKIRNMLEDGTQYDILHPETYRTKCRNHAAFLCIANHITETE